MWDEKTVKLFEEKAISKKEKTTLQAVIDMKRSESSNRKEADVLKESAKILGLELMMTRGLDKVKAEGIGTLSITTGETITYDGDKIAKSLLAQGVDLKVVNKAIKAGKTTTPWKPGLKFLAARVK